MIDFVEATDGSVRLRNLEVLLESHSDRQSLTYYRSPQFGRVLVLDDELQHVEAWSFVYHEMVTHLPASFIPNLSKVLILGGGDLLAAREILKYKTVGRIDLIEHDANVVDATIEVYPELSCVLNDHRLHIHFSDAFGWLTTCKNKYDLILNDCCDLVEVKETVAPDIYEIIRSRLSPGGICSDLVYRHVLEVDKNRRAILFSEATARSAFSLVAVPEYPGALHILTMWGPDANLDQMATRSCNEEQIRLAVEGRFAYFDPSLTGFYLYLPPGFFDRLI